MYFLITVTKFDLKVALRLQNTVSLPSFKSVENCGKYRQKSKF